jgi:hypothetical protein
MSHSTASFAATFILIVVALPTATRSDAAERFSTDGHTVYHLRMAR